MWQYLTDSYNWSGNEGIWARTVQHLWYTFAALGLSVVIALPLIISGVRSATLQIVSTATIAALVSLGGLGRYVVDGLKLRDFPQMFTGALLVALLAIALDLLFALIGRLTVSDGLKIG